MRKFNTSSTSASTQKLKVFSSYVEAGFPSPAEEYLENSIDLNELLIKNPPATFLVRAKGESMIGVGIFEGSLLVVDRALEVRNGLICIAYVNGEFTVKRFFKKGSRIELHAANEAYNPIIIKDEDQFEVWGVVRSVITKTI
jgi:DNA polymerase V